MHTEDGLHINTEQRSSPPPLPRVRLDPVIRLCRTGELTWPSRATIFPISPLPRLPPSGALSFLLCPRPSASLRNQTFPVTDRQRPVEDVYPGRYRSMLRVSDSQKVQSPRPGRGARTSSPTRSPGDGGTHATAPAEPGRDRTFVGSGTSPGVCWEGAGAQPRHIGLRKERFDLRTRRSEARRKGAWQGSREARRRRRGGSPGSPCKRGAPARGRRSRRGRGARRAEKPRKERALPSRGRLRGKGAQGAGTRTGRGTHRACGGGSAGRRGAGCILPPQAGFEALHGQVRAVPLPAGATRLPCARTLKSGLAAPAEEHTAVPAISAPPATWRPPATAGCQSQ